MTDQAPEIAAARIERALARIEAASAVALRRHADLAERHAVLRGQIGDAIAQIDSLIAAEKGAD